MPSAPPDDPDDPDDAQSDDDTRRSRSPDNPDSRLEHAWSLLRRRPRLTAVPAVASLLSVTSLARALDAGPGGGVTFPLPSGLPTVWTYASLPNTTGPAATETFGLGGVAAVLFGAAVAGVLEAGLLGTFDSLADGLSAPGDAPHGKSLFRRSVARHGLPVVAAQLLRAGVVLAVLPVVLVAPTAAVIVFPIVFVVSYALYGLPFVIVVEARGFRSALDRTLQLAGSGGNYPRFAITHVLAGAAVSLPVSSLIRGGVTGVTVAVALTAPVGALVAAYGVLVFRDTAETVS